MTSVEHEPEQAGLHGLIERANRAEATERAGSELNRPAWPYLALFTGAYLFGIWIGYGFSLAPGSGVTLWPPSGLFLATALLTDKKHWPWWAMAGLPAEVLADWWLFDFGLIMSVPIYLGNMLEGLVGAWLIRRWCGTPFRLEKLRDVIVLTLLGAAVAPFLSATVGSITLAASGLQSFVVTWPLWWIGDATGILIFAPLILAVAPSWQALLKEMHAHWAEGLAVGAVFLCAVHFSLAGPAFLAYVVVPALLWVAIRFEIAGAVTASLALALMTTGYTGLGIGQFAGTGASPEQTQLIVQFFLGILCLTALITAALSGQFKNTLLALQSVRDDLEARVAERTAQLRESQQWLLRAQRAARAGVWQLDLDTGEFKASDEALKLHGLAPGTLMTHDKALAAVHPDDRAEVEEALRQTGQKNAPFRIELRSHQPDGSTRWLLSQAEKSGDGKGKCLVGLVQDITDRKKTEEQVRLLMREINHRSKNLLALVQVVARRTAGDDLEDFRQRFEHRIHALAAHQDLLLRKDGDGVELKDLVHEQLAHFQDLIEERITISGPSMIVTAAASQTLSMALHELATNASKYGALSWATGKVEITWTLSGDCSGDGRFSMIWEERKGPPVLKPARRGFGSTLVEQMVGAELSAEVTLDFAPDGLRWHFECPAQRLVQAVG